MTSVIFFSHPEEQCGVHQFGRQIFAAVNNSSRFDFIYCDVSSSTDVRDAVLKYDPAAVLVNFHPATVGWIAGWPLWSLQVPTIGIMHEMTDPIAEQTDDALFDYYIFHDPSAELRNPLFFTAGRLIGQAPKSAKLAPRLTIGSFGFATPGKGFEAVAARAHAEFDDCVIRFNIPSSEFSDKDGSEARKVADRCRSIICKPGVHLEITHEFMDLEDVKNFLAGNSLNAFFYDEQSGRGISSAVDLALAARRPIALRRTSMVRHLFDAAPSIFIEERSLREIVGTGLTPLQPFIDRWTAENIRADYERILQTVLRHEALHPKHLRWHRHVAKMDVVLTVAKAKTEELTARNIAYSNELLVLRAELSSLKTQLSKFNTNERLMQELRIDNGPLALRAVLPVARLLRKIHVTFCNKQPAPAATSAMAHETTSPTLGKIEVARALQLPVRTKPDRPRPSLIHPIVGRLALIARRIGRPVIRPILLRFRSFVTADVQEQLREIQRANTATLQVIEAVLLSLAASNNRQIAGATLPRSPSRTPDHEARCPDWKVCDETDAQHPV